MDYLTLKQRLFIEKYLETGGNSTRAYMHAYKQSNVNAAAVSGHRLIRSVKIQGFLETLRAQVGVSDEDIGKAIKRKVDLNSYSGIRFAFKLLGFKNI